MERFKLLGYDAEFTTPKGASRILMWTDRGDVIQIDCALTLGRAEDGTPCLIPDLEPAFDAVAAYHMRTGR